MARPEVADGGSGLRWLQIYWIKLRTADRGGHLARGLSGVLAKDTSVRNKLLKHNNISFFLLAITDYAVWGGTTNHIYIRQDVYNRPATQWRKQEYKHLHRESNLWSHNSSGPRSWAAIPRGYFDRTISKSHFRRHNYSFCNMTVLSVPQKRKGVSLCKNVCPYDWAKRKTGFMYWY
jgi:hypothetical protein